MKRKGNGNFVFAMALGSLLTQIVYSRFLAGLLIGFVAGLFVGALVRLMATSATDIGECSDD